MKKFNREKFEELEKKEVKEKDKLESEEVERAFEESHRNKDESISVRLRNWMADIRNNLTTNRLKNIGEQKNDLIGEAQKEAAELNERLDNSIRNAEQTIIDFLGFNSAFGDELTEIKLKLSRGELSQDIKGNPSDGLIRDKLILENLHRKKLEEALNLIVEAIQDVCEGQTEDKNDFRQGLHFRQQLIREIEKTVDGCKECALHITDKSRYSWDSTVSTAKTVMCPKHSYNPDLVERVQELRNYLFTDPSDRLRSLTWDISPGSEKNSSDNWDEKRIMKYSSTAKNFIEELQKTVPYAKSVISSF